MRLLVGFWTLDFKLLLLEYWAISQSNAELDYLVLP